MIETHVDESVRENWKEYPVRIRGLKNSQCHGKPTVLVQFSEGGFVQQICTECKEPEYLTEADFLHLDLWVACPGCQKPMQAELLPDSNYGYVCKQCDKNLKLATLLPRFKNLL